MQRASPTTMLSPRIVGRFIVVGTSVAAIYIVLSLALNRFIADLRVASAIAFAVAVAIQYLGHRLYTFGSRNRKADELFRFLVVISLGIVLSFVITHVGGAMSVSPILSLLTVAVVTPLVNFIFFSLWVFVARDGGRQ